MLTDVKIIEILNNWLNAGEEAGENAGGSGHLAFVSLKVDEILEKKKVDEGYSINFKYSKSVETEFTCYPDNLPYEYSGMAKVMVLNDGTIVEMEK